MNRDEEIAALANTVNRVIIGTVILRLALFVPLLVGYVALLIYIVWTL